MQRKLDRRRLFTVTTLLVGALGASGCDKLQEASEELCGPCGTVATGDFSVSGNAQLDGFFQAVGTLETATAGIRADFEANVRALAHVYGVSVGATVDAAAVDAVILAIQNDISANVQGGLQINYKPAQCQANVSVAVDAQAKCEAKANCDVTVQPGQASVQCSGSCSGSCSGTCSGTASCAVRAPTVNCEGQCEGSCELSAAAACTGTCHGTCSGTCSATDASGECHGQCTGGTCQGTCEFSGKATCTGTCNGTCYVDQGSVQCTGGVECAGTCDAECTGSCEGDFKPPSASANCSATAECEAQASAQAKASLECTPPRLDIAYTFAANADQAGFTARLAELRVRGTAILQGAARLSALVTGQVEGKAVFSPAPVVQITTSISGFVSGGVDGFANLDIPKGRLVCVVPAFEEAAVILGGIATRMQGTIDAQVKFAAVLT